MASARIAWSFIGEESLLANAEQHENKRWRKRTTYQGVDFIKYQYVCCTKGCPAKMMVQTKRTPQCFRIYRAEDHSEFCSSVLRETICVKEKVLECISKGIKQPFYIHQELEKENIVVNSRTITTIKYRAKAKTASTTYNAIAELCNDITTENQDILIKETYENAKMRILITHKGLLSKASTAKTFHLDGTYKLSNLNYPIIIFGTSDNNGSFHLTGICIACDESADTYRWSIQMLSHLYQQLGHCFEPENIVGDAAPQIDLVARQLFPNTKRTHCWAHVWRNISKHTLALDSQKKQEMDDDIHLLQRLNTEILFKIGCTHFIKKRENFSCVLPTLNLVKSQFFTKDCGWFEGNYIFGPSTNNCLETFNSTFKKRYFDWTRLGMIELIKLLVLVLNDQNKISEAKHILGCPFSIIQYTSKSKLCSDNMQLELLDRSEEISRFIAIALDNISS
ncbi:hypothetical protein ENBRE01_1617 [Enteropsectra breve]|nr:hypothetical protein ENBRE01_1617 [Enteropsectra breve]